jgi:hypothetical protein
LLGVVSSIKEDFDKNQMSIDKSISDITNPEVMSFVKNLLSELG